MSNLGLATPGRLHFLPVTIGLLTLARTAGAQWNVTILHPVGATQSSSLGVTDGQQVGFSVTAGADAASLWSSTAASWVNLNPSGALESHAYAAVPGQQIGDAFVNSQLRASLWTGNAASWVDLSPAWTFRSQALGASSSQQVGYARIGLFDHAGFWTGTAGSWTDLHPAGADSSSAYAAHGTMQVGSAIIVGVLHASSWNGTAASWVDLHPPGVGATGSAALAVHQSRIAGYAAGVGGHASHACLWNGPIASYVDLNPAGSTESQALGLFGDVQVGYVRINAGQSVASLWRNAASSWEDLSLALPGSWVATRAEKVWANSAGLFVVGHGFNLGTNRREAILWVRTLCYANCDGSTTPPVLNVNDFTCFLNKYAAGDPFANCDGSTVPPVLNVNDFTCFLNQYAAGCP